MDQGLNRAYPQSEAISVNQITRERLRELIALAYETVDYLESKGLKLGEQCAFREAAERIWFSPKA